MNFQLENLPHCLTNLRVEVPADKVGGVRDSLVAEYTQYAKLPGYRPGKAPRVIVEAKFKKEIREELEKRLVSDAVREAIREHKLRVLSVSNVEDVEVGEDKALRFNATLVLSPAFDLPEYKSLAVEVPSQEITEADLDASVERFREQFADYTDVTGRPTQKDDYVVLDYSGTVGGQPVNEAVPKASRQLAAGEDFWIKLTPDAFLPGFSEKLEGAIVGDTREFDITLAEDFPIADLAGKEIHYSVTLKGHKEQVLPALDDELAAKIVPGKTLAELRELAKGELERQRKFEGEQAKRDQIVRQLLEKVECELPENLVRNETHRILTDLVYENQSRGIEDEVIKQNQAELLAAASKAARERLKGTFILVRIAEEEKITVSKEEFDQRINLMAARYNQTADKLRKDLEKAGALERVHEEILTGKTLDFLASGASVTESAPAAETAGAAS